MNYTELLASIERVPEAGVRLSIPPDWTQGRTTYGGLSGAICLEAAKPLSDGKPLRSAQIAFIGPAGGDVEATATCLRLGKNTAYVSVDLHGENGIGTRALFAFGARRDSQLAYTNGPVLPSEAGAPEAFENFFRGNVGPTFARQFDFRHAFGAALVSGADTADLGLWMRHADRDAPDDMTALLAIGDAPPPAAMSLLSGPARISSMTWSIDVLTDAPVTDEGWWFARHTAEQVREGYSAQNMSLWNRAGVPVMLSRQTIAVFD